MSTTQLVTSERGEAGRKTMLCIAILLVAATVLAVLLRGRLGTVDHETVAQLGDDPWAPTALLPASPKLIEPGKRTFEKECAACRGISGDGEGEAAYLLYPRPRDFTSGQFRLVSMWDNVSRHFRTLRCSTCVASGASIFERQRTGSTGGFFTS